MREIFFALCKSVDSPVSLGAWLRFTHNQGALADMEISKDSYLDRSRFELDYLVVSFLSKWKGLVTGNDLEAEAIRRFKTSEDSCRETNVRIRAARKGSIDPFLSSVIYGAKVKIAKLLGPFSNFCIEPGFGWGPGATSDISRRRAAVDLKLSKLPISVTPKALPLLESVIGLDLHWSSVVLRSNACGLATASMPRDKFLITEECVIDTVPKNAKTHRVIAKEPTGNGFLQKGFGRYFRKRLLRGAGIDLDDQTANQRAAKAAHLDRLATLDLKNASDSVAVELVYELLPVDWAIALDNVRSPKAILPDGETITLQKFSSMGNGFTFELETLIFWAITSSVRDIKNDRSKVWVYGDDIICSSEISATITEELMLHPVTRKSPSISRKSLLDVLIALSALQIDFKLIIRFERSYDQLGMSAGEVEGGLESSKSLLGHRETMVGFCQPSTSQPLPKI